MTNEDRRSWAALLIRAGEWVNPDGCERFEDLTDDAVRQADAILLALSKNNEVEDD
jgi:hypothetical protein